MDVDIQACVNGNKRAWDHFVKRTSAIIYAAVHRAMGSKAAGGRDDVDDRVQDVYVRLIRNDCRLLKTYDSSRASLSTWLTLVSRSVVYEQYQKKSLKTVAMDSAEASEAHDRSISESKALNDSPALAFDALTDRQRLVLRMLFDEGMSVEEAARRMEVDPQTIRSTKHKALTRLRQHLPTAETGARAGTDAGTGAGAGFSQTDKQTDFSPPPSQGDVSPESSL